MKTFILSLALLYLAGPGIASAMERDRLLTDLARSGSIVHTAGVWGGR